MRDDRLNNLKGEMNSLSSMQAMTKYFMNPENKDTFFVEYERYMHPATHDMYSGAISRMPYLVMTEMLDKLMPTKVDINGKETVEYPFGKKETEDFLRKNAYSFLSICPKEFTSKCPDDVLKDMADGKFRHVEVEKLSIKEFEEGESRDNVATSFDSFNKTSGPMVAQLIMNARKINPDIDVSQVVDAFLMAEKYRDSYHAAKKSEFNVFNFDENKDVIVVDSMYSNPARDNMPNTLYFKGSLFKDIDKSVMDFIKSNLKELTKGMAPIVAVGEQGKEAKGIVSFFKDLAKNYEGPLKDISAEKEKVDLANVDSIMKTSILKTFVDNTKIDNTKSIANDVLENDTLSKPVENDSQNKDIDNQNRDTDDISY